MLIPNFDDIYNTSANTTSVSTTYDSFDTKIFDFTAEIDFSNLEQHPTTTSPQPILQPQLPSYTFMETINQSNDQYQFLSQSDTFDLPVTLTTDVTYDDTIYDQTPRIITSFNSDEYSLSPLSLALSPSSTSSSYSPKSYSLMNPVKNCSFNLDFTCLENCFSNQDLNYDSAYTITTSNDTYTISNEIQNFDCQSYLIDSSPTSTTDPISSTTTPTTSSDPIELINLDDTESNSSPLIEEQLSPIIIDDDLANSINSQPYVINKPSEDLKKKCKEHLIELDRQKRTRKCSHLWQFCACLLDDEIYNPSLIKWLNIDEGIFKIVEPDRVAELWGAQKTRRFDKKMTYEKMARGMRYSRSEGFFKKLDKQKNKPNEYGKQFVFQFSDKVVKNFVWKTNLFPKE